MIWYALYNIKVYVLPTKDETLRTIKTMLGGMIG